MTRFNVLLSYTICINNNWTPSSIAKSSLFRVPSRLRYENVECGNAQVMHKETRLYDKTPNGCTPR